MFFPAVGTSFEVRPLSRLETVGRLAAPLLPIHRFADDGDRRGFLEFLSGAARQAECFALTLTPDLDDLQQLVQVLR
jgi:hypothetical protein